MERTRLQHTEKRTTELGRTGVFADFVPDARGVGFFQEQAADDKRDSADGERIVKAGENITGGRTKRKADNRQQAAENAIADVIRKRERGEADARREGFDKIGGKPRVNHGENKKLGKD